MYLEKNYLFPEIQNIIYQLNVMIIRGCVGVAEMPLVLYKGKKGQKHISHPELLGFWMRER